MVSTGRLSRKAEIRLCWGWLHAQTLCYRLSHLFHIIPPVLVPAKFLQSYPAHCTFIASSPSVSSLQRASPIKIVNWLPLSEFSRRRWASVLCLSALAGRCFSLAPPGKPQRSSRTYIKCYHLPSGFRMRKKRPEAKYLKKNHGSFLTWEKEIVNQLQEASTRVKSTGPRHNASTTVLQRQIPNIKNARKNDNYKKEPP